MREADPPSAVRQQENPSPPSPETPSAASIRVQLGKILTSPGFAHAERKSRFLRFTVESSLAGHADQIKEYLVGVEVFDREASYNPQIDPIVRVEAGRVRSKLKEYYETEGRQDPVVIEFPKGSYVPVFKMRDAPSAGEPQAPVLPEREQTTPLSDRRRLVWVSGLLVCLVVLVVAVWLWHWSHQPPEAAMTVMPLTSYPGHERYPSFSPDGNQVAFSWNGEKQDNFDIYVKVIGTGDQPLRLTRDRAEDWGPAWSPDGRWIAFLRNLSAERSAVLLVSPIGGSQRKLGEVQSFPLSSPLTWSPRGDALVVSHRDSDSGPPDGLYVLSVESGEKRRLTLHPSTGHDCSPAFSADGRTLAFVRAAGTAAADVYVLPVGDDLKAAGESKRITFGQWQVNNPAWGADGHEVIFSAGFTRSFLFGSGSLWRMPASGLGKPQRLAVGEGAFGLSISRQKHRLVYSRELDNVDIWRLEIPGSSAKATSPQRFIASTRDESQPQFSPDGKKIAFTSNRSGTGEIWICDSDGSNPVQLTSFGRGQAAAPRWSPDNRQVVFHANLDEQMEVYSVDPNGGRPRQLTSHADTDDFFASWSTDGNWIYFTSNRNGSYQVWKMPASGGEASQLTQTGGSHPLESPDGKFVYYTKGANDRRIWKTPSQRGKETHVLGPVIWRNFDVVREGIYFIVQADSGPGQEIRFLSFRSEEITLVAAIENSWSNFISVSPDGRWLLFPKLNPEGSDLILVENFR